MRKTLLLLFTLSVGTVSLAADAAIFYPRITPAQEYAMRMRAEGGFLSEGNAQESKAAKRASQEGIEAVEGKSQASSSKSSNNAEAITPAQEAAYKAEMNAQQQAIIHREAIKQRELYAQATDGHPTSARSKAILAHLRGLSAQLEAAAKKKEAPETQAQLISEP